MTLTQVSTWFANARRRLKKEKAHSEDNTDESLDEKGNKRFTLSHNLIQLFQIQSSRKLQHRQRL